MELRDLLEHIRNRENQCPFCHHRYLSAMERFDHVLKCHARDFEEAVEILDGEMMPLFGETYVSGPDGVNFIGVTNEDYVELLCEEGNAIAQAYSGEE